MGIVMTSDLEKSILYSKKVCYEHTKNLNELNAKESLSVEPNKTLDIQSSMMLEEFCNTNNQGLLPENFLKLVHLDSNIY